MGVRIQELPETTGINKEDVLIVEDGQGTKKGTVQQLDESLGVSQLKEDLSEVTEAFEVSRNLWDEQWEVGAISANGQNVDASSGIRSKNYIECLPNTDYYFMKSADILPYFYREDKSFIMSGIWSSNTGHDVQTTPSDAKYIRFRTPASYGIVYKNDICVNLSDAYNGVYEPYYSPRKTAIDIVARKLIEDAPDIGDMVIDKRNSDNIVPPNTESGAFTDKGVPRTASWGVRTPNAISVDGYNRVYVNLKRTFANYFSIVCYRDEEPSEVNFIKTLSFNATSQTYEVLSLPIGTRYIRLCAGVSDFDFVDCCVSFTRRETYTPYSTSEVLKEEYINNNSLPYKNKTIVNFGDSIFGLYLKPDDISERIAQITGANVVNCGFGGTSMATHYNEYYKPYTFHELVDAIVSNDYSKQDEELQDYDTSNMKDVFHMYEVRMNNLKSLNFNEVSAITIAYGTNDFAFNIALDNESNRYDVTTYAGALRYSLDKFMSAYPHIKVFLCTPIFRQWSDGVDSDSKTQEGNNVKITDFVSKLKEVADEYHIACIDNYHELGINKFNRLWYFDESDGTHPNQNGIKLIGEHIAHELF